MNQSNPNVAVLSSPAYVAAYDAAHAAVFEGDGDAFEALTTLANAVEAHDLRGGDIDWSTGEFNASDLSGLIIGAHWYAADSHGGQWSPGYALLSAVGRVYQPGCGARRVEDAESEGAEATYCALANLDAASRAPAAAKESENEMRARLVDAFHTAMKYDLAAEGSGYSPRTQQDADEWLEAAFELAARYGWDAATDREWADGARVRDGIGVGVTVAALGFALRKCSPNK